MRRDLNLEIRRARVTGREIEEGRSFPVLAPVRQGITVEGYQLGDTLHFSGERAEDGRTVAWGARLHAEGKWSGSTGSVIWSGSTCPSRHWTGNGARWSGR